MKGYVFHAPGQSSWQDVPDPVVKEPADAVVRVDCVTICGTDLRTVRPGDRVLVSCITVCGRCLYCRRAMYGQCRGGGGWILGHLIDGTQAEYVVPFADLSVHPLPETLTDRDAVLLADIFPTAYEVGVLNGRVRPGDAVAVVGAGPIGLAAIATARLCSPERIIAVDPSAARREAARRLGDAVADPAEAPEELTAHLTDGLGADVVVEAVGIPETFELCTRMVRPGGCVANVGVHGKPATLHLEDLWIKNVTITTGLVDTHSTPTLLRMAAAGRLPTSELVTHTFQLERMEEAYDVFGRAAQSGALKVVLGGQPPTELAVRAA
ncbi:zinc-binding dehydrogenase [Streptomyces sp. NPDC014006]|uniref:zinc-binding dehydrogenase n=1 Tax=Streptomyces sp. NPDC014006 TaxID=3364870 RepID=UPI0036FFDFAA